MQLPEELQQYIQTLPPSTQNNARSIVRQNFERILKLNPMTAEQILANKYGIFLDCDRTAKDCGGEPQKYEHD